MTFTDLAFDGTSIVWRIMHHCHAVPETMARPARNALAALDAGNRGPVVFVASGGGAVALHSGGVPFGAGPAARVLAQSKRAALPTKPAGRDRRDCRWTAAGGLADVAVDARRGLHLDG